MDPVPTPMDTTDGAAEGPQSPSALDSFQEIIANEKIFEEDPKEIKDAHEKDALESYQKLIAKFMQIIPKLSFANIEDNLLALTKDLRSLDEEVGAEALLPGYVSHHLLPQLVFHLIQLINNHLSAAHRLHSQNAVEFVIQIGKRMYPKVFSNSAWTFIRWDDLLDPETAPNCLPIISADIDADLTLKAEAKRDLIAAKWHALQKHGQVTQEKHDECAAEMDYTLDIWSGRYPPGLNTESEERWKQFDIGSCLDPAFDNTDYIHILYPKNMAYLTRLAEELKGELMEKVKRKPELQTDPYTIALAARLDAFIQHKTLPKGWRVEAVNVEMK